MFLLHQLAILFRMFHPSRMLRRLLQVLQKDQGQTILFSNNQKSDKLPGRSTPFRMNNRRSTVRSRKGYLPGVLL